MAQRNQQQAPPPPQENPMNAIKKFLEGDNIRKRFEEIMGKRANAFLMSVLQIINNEKNLQTADLQSIYNAAAKAAVCNLPLDSNLQYAHIVPYKDNKSGITYAQFQIGWRGIVQLAQRTGQYKTINVTEVRDGELVSEDPLTGDCVFKWEQDYTKRQSLVVIGYVSFFSLTTGFQKMVFWRNEKIQAHARKYSKSYNNPDGKWNTDWDPMSKKTVLKENLSKWGPLSVELSDAFKFDQAVIDDDGKPNYLDSPFAEFQDLTDEEADRIANETKAKQAAESLKQDLNNQP